MCLALPARILSINESTQAAVVDAGGIQKTVSLALLCEPRVGDYVLVHVGYVIATIDESEAEKTLALFAEAYRGGGSAQ